MRIGVLSDSHGDASALRHALYKMELGGRLDACLHLGDGAPGFLEMAGAFPERYAVRGNCDGQSGLALERVLTLGGARLLLAHGHTYRVKLTTALLCERARELGVQAALFGHTHQPLCEYRAGLLLLNPGACCAGRCAVLEVGEGRVRAQLIP